MGQGARRSAYGVLWGSLAYAGGCVHLGTSQHIESSPSPWARASLFLLCIRCPHRTFLQQIEAAEFHRLIAQPLGSKVVSFWGLPTSPETWCVPSFR